MMKEVGKAKEKFMFSTEQSHSLYNLYQVHRAITMVNKTHFFVCLFVSVLTELGKINFSTQWLQLIFFWRSISVGFHLIILDTGDHSFSFSPSPRLVGLVLGNSYNGQFLKSITAILRVIFRGQYCKIMPLAHNKGKSRTPMYFKKKVINYCVLIFIPSCP